MLTLTHVRAVSTSSALTVRQQAKYAWHFMGGGLMVSAFSLWVVCSHQLSGFNWNFHFYSRNTPEATAEWPIQGNPVKTTISNKDYSRGGGGGQQINTAFTTIVALYAMTSVLLCLTSFALILSMLKKNIHKASSLCS